MKERSITEPPRVQATQTWNRRPTKTSGRPKIAAGQENLMLISNDPELRKRVHSAARRRGRTLLQLDGASDALHLVRLFYPVAVLLDLDLPEDAAWKMADDLLQEDLCPPIVLLTARGNTLDLGAAIQTGSILDKLSPPDEFLHALNQAVENPRPGPERNAAQQVMIRWLKPCRWPVEVGSRHRFWGINE